MSESRTIVRELWPDDRSTLMDVFPFGAIGSW